MRNVFLILTLTGLLAGICSAQRKAVAKSEPAKSKAPVAAVPKSIVDKGSVGGRTYANARLNFSITFPNAWLIPGDDFEAYMQKQGFDLSLKAPDNLGPLAKAKVNQSLKQVEILVTAYRSMPGSTDNAIMRASAEDLKNFPQIKDAVDYIDAVRESYETMKLPADFKYSETQAEKLGPKQFAFLDTSSNAGKKRMYATVSNGFAVLFTLSYRLDEDLLTMRHILTDGNFSLK